MNATTEDNPTTIETEYIIVNLDQVIRFFVQAYKLSEGEITNHESFVDVARGKVVLKVEITTPKE